MAATLRLTRQGFGIELRRGQFAISVDGERVGSLVEYGDTLEAPVEPGHHTIRVTSGRYSSRDRSFDATDGDVVNFRCHGAMVWPRWVTSFAMPQLAISLKRG